MKLSRTLPLVAFSALALSACSDTWFGDPEKPPLPGERVSILEMQNQLMPEGKTEAPFALPEVWDNDFWPQAGGYPNHAMQNLALNSGELKLAWKTDIGEGGSTRMPLTARPVVADGRIFALDTDNRLSAYSIKDGAQQWKMDARKPGEKEPVIAGGIAFSGGVLYVSAGFDEIIAVNPATGDVYWRAKIDSPSRAAPTIEGGRVFVVTQTNTLSALDAKTGAALWDYSGMEGSASLVSGASPAAEAGLVVPAFTSGEIYALRVENGSLAWSDNLASMLRLGGLGGISDISGYPVIDKGLVFAISYAGRMVAIDAQTGTRIWTRELGGAETPWVAGNSIFTITTQGELVAMARETGAVRWVTQMKRYEDPETRKHVIIWKGPVLAGGRLIVGGTGGRMAEIDPATGKLTAQWSVGKNLTIPPIVAGQTLYLLADDGTLLAYR